MTRARWLLAGVIVAELAVGGFFAARRLTRPTAPVPDLSIFDPITAGELRDLSTRCDTPDGWAKLGEAYLATGYFPEGEACYREASRQKPDDPDLAFKHAFALERLGQLDEANARYRTAIDLRHPRSADAWYYIGRNHLRLEQPEPAADALRHARDLPASRYELARLDWRAGRASEAAAECQRLASEFPGAREPTALLIRLALGRGDRREADALGDRFYHQRAGLPNPFDVEFRWLDEAENRVGWKARFREATQDAAAGRYDKADREFGELIAASWTSQAADQLAEVKFHLGQSEESLKLIEDAIARDGPSFQLLWRLGDAYEAVHKPTEARAAWERAAHMGTGPEPKDLRHKLATIYEQSGDKDRAAAWHALAFLSAGMAELDAGRPADAIAALNEAVRYDPRLAHGWYYLGEARRALGRPAEARQAYERCLQLDPDHGRAARALRLLGPG